MYDIVSNFMVLLSIFTIIVIAIQPTKTKSSSNAFMGGSELFTQTKARGFEAFLIKVTIGCLVLFMLIPMILVNL